MKSPSEKRGKVVFKLDIVKELMIINMIIMYSHITKGLWR